MPFLAISHISTKFLTLLRGMVEDKVGSPPLWIIVDCAKRASQLLDTLIPARLGFHLHEKLDVRLAHPIQFPSRYSVFNESYFYHLFYSPQIRTEYSQSARPLGASYCSGLPPLPG